MRAAVALLVLLAVAPVIAVVVLLRVAPYEPPSRAVDDVPIAVPVVQERPTVAIPAELAVVWTTPEAIVSNDAVGIVSKVFVQPGAVLRGGDEILEVGGATVLAYVGDTPFWRDLGFGDKGSDVEALAGFLKSLGYVEGDLPDPVDTVDRQLSDAIDRYLLATRWPREERRTRSGVGPVFPLESVLYAGASPIEVGDVSVAVGHPMPPSGTAVITTAQRIVDVRVELSESPADGAILGPTAVFIATNTGLEVPLSGPTLDVTAEVIAGLEAALPIDEPRHAGSVVGGGDDQLPAVPVSAVVQGSGGTCVFSQDGTEYPVEIVASQGGLAFLVGASLPTEVIANPAAALPSASCS